MASLELDPESGRYRVRFRYHGQPFKRSLRTKSKRVAQASLGQVEETLRLLELGLTEILAFWQLTIASTSLLPHSL